MHLHLIVSDEVLLPPCPSFSIRVELPALENHSARELSELPAKPGVLMFQDQTGGTLALLTTANLRRMAQTRLEPLDEERSTPTRRVDYRSLTRTVLAVPVGSAFEADWAYLQLARRHLPHTYRGLLDRWQAWFVQCDPHAPFPQWTKTAHPTLSDSDSTTTVHAGPMSDKHAAGRYLDTLQEAFDLCRYHHILVQAPHGKACAYKEMGKCPAPCDGTVSMDHYRRQIADSIDFACTPDDRWRTRIEELMNEASHRLDFEAAQRFRLLLERTALAGKPSFAHVQSIDRFAFLAVMPGEKTGWARLVLIFGGWVAPILDLPIDAPSQTLREVVELVLDCVQRERPDFSSAGVENMGLICARLFRPRTAKARPRGEFIRLGDQLTETTLRNAFQRLAKKTSDEQLDAFTDQGIERE